MKDLIKRTWGAPKIKIISPDPNAWLVHDFVSACKNFQNEFGLTLWEALNEYVSYHNPYCAYLDRNYERELYLYPVLDYNPESRRATLKKLFYVSDPVKTIFMHDYLKTKSTDPNKTPFTNLLSRSNQDKFEEFPELEFMIMQNNIEPALAKEMLLKTSFYRRSVKKAFILENEALGIEYKSTNVVSIDFDLTMLDSSSFLDAKRYESFRDLLPKNLVITVGCRLEFDLPDIPKHLKQQQLLEVGSINN